jgi:membrane protease YdiL (CAAX protease family)
VQTCGQCGALSPLSAAWCSQCCLPFQAPVPVLAYANTASAPARPLASATATPGWVPPSPPPLYTEEHARRDGRLLDRKAAVLVALAIGSGGIVQLVAVSLAHSTSIEPDTLIRYDLVLTLGLYAVVAAMIVSQITPSIRLRWGDGSLAVRVGVGAGVGIGFSVALLALVSVAAGHLQTDPRIVLLMSEGDPTHIVVTVFLGCVAAPLVEETLFRGLLLESLRPRGKLVAILVSAGAFAVWHFMPASLVYYAALGAALGGLYLKRGLACSIAAHVGFNSVLTIAAISMVLGPSHVIQIGQLSLTAPSGWSVDASPAVQFSGADSVLVGPSDAELEVIPGPAVTAVSPDAIAARLRSGALPLSAGLGLDTSSVSEVPTPAGEVVEIQMTLQGRQGTLGLLAADGQSYELIFLSAGSEKAIADFPRMLASLHLS